MFLCISDSRFQAFLESARDGEKVACKKNGFESELVVLEIPE
jgi:hypothetical protein